MGGFLRSGAIALAFFNTLSFAAADGLIDPAAMDTSVSPCEDFYQYACGSWIEHNQIPSDQSRWYRSFSILQEKNQSVLHNILENYAHGDITPNVPYAQKLSDFYASCMDTDKIAKDTPQIVSTLVARVNSLTSKQDLAAYVAELHMQGLGSFFSFGNQTDLDDPKKVIASVDQSGTSLPDTTYYTATDAAGLQLLEKFKAHIQTMFQLAGYDSSHASSAAAAAYAMEQKLAAISLPSDQLQDATKLHNIQALSALEATAPSFNWTAYIHALGISAPATLNVGEPAFFTGLEKILNESDLDSIKAYLLWQNLEAAAGYLGSPFYDEWFQFDRKTLEGQKAPAPRWKTCVNSVGAMSTMGDALGNAFVTTTFSPAAKVSAKQMIDQIEGAFAQNLATIPWLDEPTRAAAQTKLSLFTDKIGYPETWKNFETLEISPSNYLQNMRNATELYGSQMLAKIGGKTDPKEWGMTPQTVNAYYSPSENQINFPAGILQHPFFLEGAHDAENYGAIGMVIGHEMTHGFDTSGSKYDGYGRVSYWWSDLVKSTFNTKAQCMKDQYSSYKVLPDLAINGSLTITENIADNGGLKISYNAYRNSRKGKGEEPPIAGLNANQQFFVSFAQAWCGKSTDASTKAQVASDPHSPARYRVIGPISNTPAFAAAFSCQPGSPMAPVHRCDIW